MESRESLLEELLEIDPVYALVYSFMQVLKQRLGEYPEDREKVRQRIISDTELFLIALKGGK